MKKAILALTALLFVPIVTGLGIAPATLEIPYEPGTNKTVEFQVINNEGLNETVKLGVEGELKDLITLHETTVKLESDSQSEPIRATFHMPKGLSQGPHTGRVIVQETETGPGTVGGKVSVASRTTILVPYEGKFIRTSFANVRERDGEAVFFIEAENLGKVDVEKATGSLAVKEKQNILKRINLGSQPIPAKTSIFFNATWKADINPGVYTAIATVRYDDNVSEAERRIQVGERSFLINSIDVTGFERDDEVTLELNLENHWNQPTDSVYAETEFSRKDESFGSSPTEVTSFEGYENKSLRAIWNAQGAPTGNYTLTVTIHYGEKTQQHTYQAKLTEETLVIEGIESERVAQEKEIPYHLILITLIILVVLLGLNHYWKQTKE